MISWTVPSCEYSTTASVMTGITLLDPSDVQTQVQIIRTLHVNSVQMKIICAIKLSDMEIWEEQLRWEMDVWDMVMWVSYWGYCMLPSSSCADTLQTSEVSCRTPWPRTDCLSKCHGMSRWFRIKRSQSNPPINRNYNIQSRFERLLRTIIVYDFFF